MVASPHQVEVRLVVPPAGVAGAAVGVVCLATVAVAVVWVGGLVVPVPLVTVHLLILVGLPQAVSAAAAAAGATPVERAQAPVVDSVAVVRSLEPRMAVVRPPHGTALPERLARPAGMAVAPRLVVRRPPDMEQVPEPAGLYGQVVQAHRHDMAVARRLAVALLPERLVTVAVPTPGRARVPGESVRPSRR